MTSFASPRFTSLHTLIKKETSLCSPEKKKKKQKAVVVRGLAPVRGGVHHDNLEISGITVGCHLMRFKSSANFRARYQHLPKEFIAEESYAALSGGA